MEWDGVVRGWGIDAGWNDGTAQRTLPVYDQRMRANGGRWTAAAVGNGPMYMPP